MTNEDYMREIAKLKTSNEAAKAKLKEYTDGGIE